MACRSHCHRSHYITYLHRDKVRPRDFDQIWIGFSRPALLPPHESSSTITPTAVSPASFPPVPHCWCFPSFAVMCFLLTSYRGSQPSLKCRQAHAHTHKHADTHTHTQCVHIQLSQMPLFIKDENVLETVYENILIGYLQGAVALFL